MSVVALQRKTFYQGQNAYNNFQSLLLDAINFCAGENKLNLSRHIDRTKVNSSVLLPVVKLIGLQAASRKRKDAAKHAGRRSRKHTSENSVADQPDLAESNETGEPFFGLLFQMDLRVCLCSCRNQAPENCSCSCRNHAPKIRLCGHKIEPSPID